MRGGSVMLGVALAVQAVPVTASPSRSARAVVEAMFAAVNRHDAETLAALYSADAEIVSSEACAAMHGPEAVRRIHRNLVRDLPDLRDEPTDWVVEGDRVAVLFTAHAKNLPGGAIRLADFLTVRGGRIVRDVTIFNAGAPCK